MDITGFNPTNGVPGTRVQIDLTEVPADGVPANTTVFLSGGAVAVNAMGGGPNGETVTVTIGANSQSGEFVVFTGQEHESAQSEEIFTVNVPPGAPAITNMQPRAGSAGTPILLTGQNLNVVQYVTIGIANVMVFTTHTATQIRFVIPSNVSAGTQRVYGRSQQFGRVNCPYMLSVT